MGFRVYFLSWYKLSKQELLFAWAFLDIEAAGLPINDERYNITWAIFLNKRQQSVTILLWNEYALWLDIVSHMTSFHNQRRCYIKVNIYLWHWVQVWKDCVSCIFSIFVHKLSKMHRFINVMSKKAKNSIIKSVSRWDPGLSSHTSKRTIFLNSRWTSTVRGWRLQPLKSSIPWPWSGQYQNLFRRADRRQRPSSFNSWRRIDKKNVTSIESRIGKETKPTKILTRGKRWTVTLFTLIIFHLYNFWSKLVKNSTTTIRWKIKGHFDVT